MKMLKNIYTLISDDFNPYKNLALEEYLLYNLQDDEVIMYLWQNKNTVVIGKNQNCRAQCKLEALQNDGGFVARRPSGGGAVFHDLGNLNFTFLAKSSQYDVDKQLEVILRAVKSLGLDATKSGRNDITINDRKFSGNAFFKAGDNKFHHGTLLINADMSRLANYLNVSTKKLESHGVKSVKSRVVNLSELNDNITVNSIKEALIKSFEEVYALKSTTLPSERIDNANLNERYKKFSSKDWLYERERKYNYILSEKFSWGECELCMVIEKAMIQDLSFFTDALDEKIADIIKSLLIGKEFNKSNIISCLEREKTDYPNIIEDIKKLIESNLE